MAVENQHDIEPLELIFGTAFPGERLGITDEVIAAAEARLGLVLPEPLKDHRVAGASRVLANADYRFPAARRTDELAEQAELDLDSL